MAALLAYYTAPGDWRDAAIRWWTGASTSHVELILAPPGTEGDSVRPDPATGWRAISASASERDGGVRRKEIAFTPDTWTLQTVPWAVAPPSDAPVSCEGARYDWRGLALSQVFGAGRHTADRWFCSEWCAHQLGMINPQQFSPGELHDAIEAGAALYRAGIDAGRNERMRHGLA